MDQRRAFASSHRPRPAPRLRASRTTKGSFLRLRITPERVVVTVLVLISLLAFGLVQRSIDVEYETYRPKGIVIPVMRPGGESSVSKALIMARMAHEGVAWVKNLPDWTHAIYTVDEPQEPYAVPANKGHEAMAYLTYIITHYEDLPEVMAFVHSARAPETGGWHNDGPGKDTVLGLRALQLGTVLLRGYVNLRCVTWPGCDRMLYPHERGEDRDDKDKPPDVLPTEAIFADAWRGIFGPHSIVPEVVGVACCAQFAVSREAVLRRRLKDYVAYRDWLLNTRLDDGLSGRVFEYLWHVIFGEFPDGEAIYCPPRDICDCEVYGLERPTCKQPPPEDIFVY